MKNIYLLCCMVALTMLSCKKSEPLPAAPTADFELAVSLAMQGTSFTPINTSQNATSYFWNFGDGTTSTEETPTFTLTTIGDHKISLTVTNADGTTSTSTKNVKIVAPIINSITVTNLQDWAGASYSSLKKFSGGDIWVEIRKSEKTVAYEVAPDGSRNYPLFYKSPVVKVQAGTTQPVVIAIYEKVILELDQSSTDKKYSFNLYVKDAAGEHMLFTSEFIGSTSLTNLAANTYSWSSRFGAGVEIKGTYY